MSKELVERVMEYHCSNGDVIKLTMNMVRRYLVSGKSELVTDQEIVFYMNICRARKLNPFLRECYLIKYSREPAAIITSIDYFRKNARKHTDCQGWQHGIIVKTASNDIRYSKGIIFDDEILIGGWFKAQPIGWLYPYELEVPLAPYIKRKVDGSITKFWRSENQSVMIEKVAEAQGLRHLWGEDASGMHLIEEINPEQNNNQLIAQPQQTNKNLYAITNQAPEPIRPEDFPSQSEPEPEPVPAPVESSEPVQPQQGAGNPSTGAGSLEKKPTIPELAKEPENLGAIDLHDPTKIDNWVRMRKGNLKTTGLFVHINQNLDAFANAWPTMRATHKNTLRIKFRRFYDKNLPWESTEPKSDPEAEQTISKPRGPNLYPEPEPMPPAQVIDNPGPNQNPEPESNPDPDDPKKTETSDSSKSNEVPIDPPEQQQLPDATMDPTQGIDLEIMDEFNQIWTTCRNTPAFHYAQGQTIGDENSSFRPDIKFWPYWVQCYHEYGEGTDIQNGKEKF